MILLFRFICQLSSLLSNWNISIFQRDSGLVPIPTLLHLKVDVKILRVKNASVCVGSSPLLTRDNLCQFLLSNHPSGQRT
jgi:hypothetical protein